MLNPYLLFTSNYSSYLKYSYFFHGNKWFRCCRSIYSSLLHIVFCTKYFWKNSAKITSCCDRDLSNSLKSNFFILTRSKYPYKPSKKYFHNSNHYFRFKIHNPVCFNPDILWMYRLFFHLGVAMEEKLDLCPYCR